MHQSTLSLVLPLLAHVLVPSAMGHLVMGPPYDTSPVNNAAADSLPRPLMDNFDDIMSDESVLRLPSYSYSLPTLGCPSTFERTESECPPQRSRFGDRSGLRSVNVTYDDCGTSFQLCHCVSADLTLDESVKLLGRVPVGLRRYAGLIAVMPVANGGSEHAYTVSNTGEIHIFGNAHVRTWLHEIAHAYDFATRTAYSLSDAFQDAVTSDSCVPDRYAQSSFPEDFAQMTVLATWLLLRDTLPTQAKGPAIDTSCMSNAMNFVMRLPAFNPEKLFGETCAIESAGEDSQGARHTAPTAQDLVAEEPDVAPAVASAPPDSNTTTEPLAAPTQPASPTGAPGGSSGPGEAPIGGARRVSASFILLSASLALFLSLL